MTTTQQLSHDEFLTQIREAISLNRPQFEGSSLDEDAAWGAYNADPTGFHVAHNDNEAGDPIVEMVLRDGPWWVPAG